MWQNDEYNGHPNYQLTASTTHEGKTKTNYFEKLFIVVLRAYLHTVGNP